MKYFIYLIVGVYRLKKVKILKVLAFLLDRFQAIY